MCTLTQFDLFGQTKDGQIKENRSLSPTLRAVVGFPEILAGVILGLLCMDLRSPVTLGDLSDFRRDWSHFKQLKSILADFRQFSLGALKGKYHANLMSFRNSKMFEQKNKIIF